MKKLLTAVALAPDSADQTNRETEI